MVGLFQGQHRALAGASCSAPSALAMACSLRRPSATYRAHNTYSSGANAATGVWPATSFQVSSRSLRCNALRPGETPEEARLRRIRESEEVERRVHYVNNTKEWNEALKAAGSKLVVLEIQSEKICQTSYDEEEVELHWKLDREAAQRERMARCVEVKHTFVRTARECTNVDFIMHEVEDEPTEESNALLDQLGVELLPTVQFWRDGAKVWEHKGLQQLEQDLGEGVLYFGDTAGSGVRATDYVTELHSKEDLQRFIDVPEDDNVLRVVDVSLLSATPCIKVYPAVLALARNFVGYASFARLQGDENKELADIMRQYKILEVPTFLFFRGGKEVGRHVGSDRADLIGQVVTVQSKFGVQPPAPKTTGARARPPPPPKLAKRQSLW